MWGRYFIAVFLLFSTLASVEVQGGFTGMYHYRPLGTTARMQCRTDDASNYKNGSAAVDDILWETSRTSGSDVVQSCRTPYPWLCIDLTEPTTIAAVRVLNRPSQEGSDRMKGFHVGFPDQCPQVGEQLDWRSHTECGTLQENPIKKKWSYVNCAGRTRERYILIQSDTDFLNLMEVQVLQALETCETRRGEDGWRKGSTCKFPQYYRGKMYDRCIAKDESKSGEYADWCYTVWKPGRTSSTQPWGYCVIDQCTEKRETVDMLTL